VLAKLTELNKKPEEPKAPETQKVAGLTEEDVRSLQTQVGTLTKTLAEREAKAAVNEAISSGKVLPAQRPWAESYALSDPAGFKTYVETAPKSAIVRTLGDSSSDDEDEAAKKVLSDAEISVASQLGSLAPSKESLLRAKSGAATVSLIDRNPAKK